MKPLRILLSLLDPPLPFGHATGRWYSVLLKGLVQRGHRVTAFSTWEHAAEVEEARRQFPLSEFDLRLFRQPERRGWLRKFQTLQRPYSYRFAPEFWTDFRAECARGYDILHMESIWSGWLGLEMDRRRCVLNFHSLYDIDQTEQPIAGWKDWAHRRLRQQAEYRLLRAFPTLATLTPRLRDGVRLISEDCRVHVVPLGIDSSLYPFLERTSRPTDPLITVIGSMNWYPSRSAAIRLLTRLWPEIKRRVPTARVRIVGWNARRELREFVDMTDIDIIENVPETRPHFEETSVLLYAPGRSSGAKVKVLEAFAYGIPVVTTSDGVEGFPAQDGIHAGICDDDAGLIERTVTLLSDRNEQERRRLAARSLLEVHNGPQATLDAMERCYADIVASAGQDVSTNKRAVCQLN